jgi:hypothetical protein
MDAGRKGEERAAAAYAEQAEIVLMRAGHYFTPTSSDGEELSGSCQGATVAHVDDMGEGDKYWQEVNLDVVTHSADHLPRLGVRVAAPAQGSASFHLTRDCPWSR